MTHVESVREFHQRTTQLPRRYRVSGTRQARFGHLAGEMQPRISPNQRTDSVMLKTHSKTLSPQLRCPQAVRREPARVWVRNNSLRALPGPGSGSVIHVARRFDGPTD